MIQLTKLTAKHIHILDDEDNEIMVDREHFEQWANIGSSIYWTYTKELTDARFKQDMRTYIAQHHDLDYISNIQNELT